MQNHVEIIAHRGASADAPENTMAAVRLGWEQGADAVEFDCRLTSDGRIVVFHDPTTERTANETLTIADATLEELGGLDVGTWKGPQWVGERIPTIEDVFSTLPVGKRMFVEVKCGTEINDTLVRALSESDSKADQFAVISYDIDVVAGVKSAMPQMEAYLVARFESDQRTWSTSLSIDELIAAARDAGLDGLDMRADDIVDRTFVEQAFDASLETYIWTVDDAEVARRFISHGVRGIATNRPAMLRKELATIS